MAPTEEQAISLSRPSTGLPASFWVGAGIFGLAGGAFLLLFTGPVLENLVRLAESYRAGGSPLTDERVAALEHGVRVWGWSGLLIWGLTLPLWHPRVRAYLAGASFRVMHLAFRPLPLPADRYGRGFYVAVAGVLAFTLMTHWSLTAYKDVDWFGGEDGVTEWWSVATYLVAAGLAGATFWTLRTTRNTKLRYLYLALAVGFFLGVMEEISWGQRLFGSGTPSALEEINFQDETTTHHVNLANNVIFEVLFWGSALGMAAGLSRLTANLSGLSDRMRQLQASLTMAPALLMILVWRTGDIWESANIVRLIMDYYNHGPRESEVPEAMLGLCIIMYTFTNL